MTPSSLAILMVVLIPLLTVNARDPDILSDYLVANLDASKFTFIGLKAALQGATPPAKGVFNITRVGQSEFPALQGLGVSYALLRLGPNSINEPHTHPRASKILLVLEGWLEVGLVDSSNKLLMQVLKDGDMFVFPKGLAHFQRNKDRKYSAHVVAAFESANPGTVVIQNALFQSGISDDMLAMAFNTKQPTQPYPSFVSRSQLIFIAPSQSRRALAPASIDKLLPFITSS